MGYITEYVTYNIINNKKKQINLFTIQLLGKFFQMNLEILI